MPDQYAVIGNPIGHSKSPLIHRAFADQAGQDLDYGRILGDLDGFEDDVARFFTQGGRGLNVTVPFKERAWALAGTRSKRAQRAGAVNTLMPLPEGGLYGDNTDGVGLVRDLVVNHGFPLSGRRVLMLGAGGAAKGVLLPLLDTGLEKLIIANRTAVKAVDLALSAADLGPVRGCGLTDLSGDDQKGFDLIINATSSGLGGEVPSLPADSLAPGGWTYDMLYGDQPTPFCVWALAQGAEKALDGLGMLVEQAAESFRLWRGVRPETGPVIQLIRNAGAA